MTKKEIAKRYLLFIIILFFSALGVAFTKHGELGVSPISFVANVMSYKFDFFHGDMADRLELRPDSRADSDSPQEFSANSVPAGSSVVPFCLVYRCGDVARILPSG